MCHEFYRECADLQLSPEFALFRYFILCYICSVLGVLFKHFPRLSFGMWVVYRGLWYSLLWSLNKLISFIENKKINKVLSRLFYVKCLSELVCSSTLSHVADAVKVLHRPACAGNESHTFQFRNDVATHRRTANN